MAIFTGAGVAIVTPFNADGSINYNKLEELIDFHCENGTDSIIICGTTGESATLSEVEHVECIKKAVEFTKGRIPVVAGTGSNSTQTAIELSAAAVEAGVDGLLVVTPYYNKATQAGLVKHYSMIAEAAKAPIIMYSVASRTGCNINPETAATLFKNVDNIVGIKEASGNISQIAKVAQLCGNDIDIYSGNDDQIIPVLSLGGKGVISVLSNIMPKATSQMVKMYLAGKTQEALKLQLELLPLINQLFVEANPIPVKAACAKMGFGENYLRLPLTSMEEKNEKVLFDLMKEQNLI